MYQCQHRRQASIVKQAEVQKSGQIMNTRWNLAVRNQKYLQIFFYTLRTVVANNIRQRADATAIQSYRCLIIGFGFFHPFIQH